MAEDLEMQDFSGRATEGNPQVMIIPGGGVELSCCQRAIAKF